LYANMAGQLLPLHQPYSALLQQTYCTWLSTAHWIPPPLLCPPPPLSTSPACPVRTSSRASNISLRHQPHTPSRTPTLFPCPSTFPCPLEPERAGYTV
jgi:hypothetical protein